MRRLLVTSTHVLPSTGFGGVAVTSAAVYRSLAEHGLRVAMYTCGVSADGTRVRRQEYHALGLKDVHPFRTLPGRFARRNGIAPILPISLLAAMVRYRREAAVLIHGVGTFPTTVALLFASLLGLPTAVYLHGGLMASYRDHLQSRRGKRAIYRIIDRYLPRVDLAIVSSEFEKSQSFPLPTRVAIIPNPVARCATRKQPIESENCRLCYIGRITPEKGILEFAKVVASYDGNVTLTIAGSGREPEDAYVAQLENLAGDSGDKVALLGEVPRDVAGTLISLSHFLVLPSGMGSAGVRENFGNVVAEALARGTPVIVARNLAWDHLDEHGAGVVFDPDPDGAEKAIRRAAEMAADDTQYRRLCDRAYELGRSASGSSAVRPLVEWAARAPR